MANDKLQLLVDKAIIAYDAHITISTMPAVMKDFNKATFNLILKSIPVISRSHTLLVAEISQEVDALIWQWCLTDDDEPFCDPRDFNIMFRDYCKVLQEQWKGELQ
jgi:hypothetical protein